MGYALSFSEYYLAFSALCGLIGFWASYRRARATEVREEILGRALTTIAIDDVAICKHSGQAINALTTLGVMRRAK